MGKDLAPRVLLAATSTLKRLGLLREQSLRALFDRAYQRFGWQRVTTEWDMETTVTRDLLTLAEEQHPLGLLLHAVLMVAPEWRTRLAQGAVLRSVGPLQVGPPAAVRLAASDGLTLDESQARALLYTTAAGTYYGVRQITPHITANAQRRALTADTSAFIATDRWLGVLASRDTAVLHQVAQLAGEPPPPEMRLRTPPVHTLLLALQSELQTPEERAGVSAQLAASRHAQAVAVFWHWQAGRGWNRTRCITASATPGSAATRASRPGARYPKCGAIPPRRGRSRCGILPMPPGSASSATARHWGAARPEASKLSALLFRPSKPKAFTGPVAHDL